MRRKKRIVGLIAAIDLFYRENAHRFDTVAADYIVSCPSMHIESEAFQLRFADVPLPLHDSRPQCHRNKDRIFG
jgi:hypothetical protein